MGLFSSGPGVSFYGGKWYNLGMKKFLSLLLTIALMLGLVSCGNDKSATAKPSGRNIEVNETELRKWLDESVGMWEFAQRFFDDTIIYKTKLGTWAFEPVNTDLPLSNYNWDNLRHAGPIANTEWEYYEDGDLKSIKGIDLSHYNVVEDWEAVKNSGVKFVMLRTGYRGYSEGGLIEDKKFVEYAKAASKQGLELGTYFVTQAINEDEAREEADYVVSLLKKAGVSFTYPIALDLEDAGSLDARTVDLSKAQRTKIIIAFCERIKEAGYEPMILLKNITKYPWISLLPGTATRNYHEDFFADNCLEFKPQMSVATTDQVLPMIRPSLYSIILLFGIFGLAWKY